MFFVFFFFFSSRRRHTRSLRDWSSDVCSSDLTAFTDFLIFRRPNSNASQLRQRRCQIGRASCRKSVDLGGRRIIKKKKKKKKKKKMRKRKKRKQHKNTNKKEKEAI